MKRSLCFAILSAASVGCGSNNTIAAYTKIEGDGSFARTVKYSLPGKGTPSEIASVYQIPSQHPGVLYRQVAEADKGPKFLITSRKVKAGHPLPSDVVALGSDGKPSFRCRAVVAKLPNGDVSYDETIHWTNSRPEGVGAADVLKGIWSQVLPAKYQDQQDRFKLVQASLTSFVNWAYGPPVAHLRDAAAEPDLIQYTEGPSLAKDLAVPLKEAIPQITDQELRETSDKLSKLDLESYFPDNAIKQATSSAQEPAPTSLLFVVRPPGPVVETNGVVTSDGHVYWSIEDLNNRIGDIVLHLVSHSGGDH